MNPWVERAAVSAAASVVSTAVWFSTARNRDGSARKRRRKKKKKATDDGQSAERAGLQDEESGALMSDNDEATPKKRKPKAEKKAGTTASRDLKDFESGMTGEQFKQNITDTAKDVASFFKGLVGSGNSEGDNVPGEDAEAPPNEEQAASDDDGKKKRRRKKKKRRKKKDGLSQLKEEAVYMATHAVKKKVVEGTGLDKAANVIKDGAGSLKDNIVEGGQLVSEKIKAAVPDDLGAKVNDAKESVVDTYERVSERVKAEVGDTSDFSELSDKVEDGLSDLGRWIQGPGAQQDKKPAENLLDSPSAGDVVEAKIADDELPSDLPRS